jgi:hypothetical protein
MKKLAWLDAFAGTVDPVIDPNRLCRTERTVGRWAETTPM